MLLEPKHVVIDNKAYILSKFPAIAGREIVTQYPLSAIPKLGEYKTNQDLMLKIMAYVAVPIKNDEYLQLITEALVNNHVSNWETLLKLEYAMMEYNCSFFTNGSLSNWLHDLAETLPAWITKILTPLSPQSLQMEKPVTESSKSTTRSKRL
jgi:hypothetical protein